jgi:hypothetical protein
MIWNPELARAAESLISASRAARVPVTVHHGAPTRLAAHVFGVGRDVHYRTDETTGKIALWSAFDHDPWWVYVVPA